MHQQAVAIIAISIAYAIGVKYKSLYSHAMLL